MYMCVHYICAAAQQKRWEGTGRLLSDAEKLFNWQPNNIDPDNNEDHNNNNNNNNNNDNDNNKDKNNEDNKVGNDKVSSKNRFRIKDQNWIWLILWPSAVRCKLINLGTREAVVAKQCLVERGWNIGELPRVTELFLSRKGIRDQASFPLGQSCSNYDSTDTISDLLQVCS